MEDVQEPCRSGQQAAAGAGMSSPSAIYGPRRLLERRLDHYPVGARRYSMLALVVASTIVAYYEQ